jgi:predicted Ser/Thr protein kinase
LSFVIRRSSFVVRRSSFVVRRSSFVVRRSSFVVRHSCWSFVVRHSSFVVCRSSFVVRHSSFVVRHFASYVLHFYLSAFSFYLLPFTFYLHKVLRMAMREPQLIDHRFQLLTQIGKGSFGRVYVGLDTQTGRQVAIKALRAEDVTHDPTIVSRFEREAEALRLLNHPNIVQILDYLRENEHHYIVMEYVEGGTLADMLQQQPQLPLERTLQIGLDLSDALARAHRLNIIHRDIKPHNVLLARDGTPRLSDFGVAYIGDRARLTQSGATVGTYAYLSPEGTMGQPVDERTDIWSFGVLLYEMLAGRRPFDSPRPGVLLTMILNHPPPDLATIRSDTPPVLVDLINRMLEKERDKRIPSVRLVGAEIEALMRGRTLILPHALSPAPPVADRLDPRVATPPPGRAPIRVEAGHDAPTVIEAPEARRAPSPPPTRPAQAPRPALNRLLIGGTLILVMIMIALVAAAMLSR